tara:strand:+ start:494 stop:988 length:495 start_codon:yes stop_codon:yes gene_type:complete
MYIDHDKKLVFIHISRTGGSSIKTALNLHDKQYNEYYHLDSSYIPKECKDYFKFAFVRNPFDRFASLYHFRPKGLSFSEWLDNINLVYVQQVDYGLDKLDFVGRYENLQDDFNKHFEGQLTIENPTQSSSIVKDKHYSEYYDNSTIEKVKQLAKDDLEVLNYVL